MATSSSLLLVVACLCFLTEAFHLNHIVINSELRNGKRFEPRYMSYDDDSLELPTQTSQQQQQERRAFLQQAAHTLVLSSIVATGSSESAADAADVDGLPPITHKVYFDVRISRSDGTFYIRDAVSTDPEDEPFIGQLVFGLFGKNTPNHVQRFLNYVDVPYDVDNPFPSYSRSRFTTLDISTGLLIGGTIPGLDVSTLAGGNVLEYGGRVIPAKLWVEDRNSESSEGAKVSHSFKGLLTHRNLDLTPSFGVTTRSSTTSLDATHTVFGCILEDRGGFLERTVDLPVLTDSGKVSRTEIDGPVTVGGSGGGDLGGALASSVFTAQRRVFRDAAKTFGDSRLDKVYDGKLLRRVEVTKVGVL
jgi:cyclophilin family peptidyl-prolyl cis-trans isomerase